MIKNLIIAGLSAALIAGGMKGYLLQAELDIKQAALATASAKIASMRLKHSRKLAKTKLRERGKRLITALPAAGSLVAAWFEREAYIEWKQEHPDGSLQQYVTELTDVVTEIAEDYRDQIGEYLPDQLPIETIRGYIIDQIEE